MRDIYYELLKELLLVREAGAFTSVDEAIDLAIYVYCEKTGEDREVLIETLKVIHQEAWEGYWDDMMSWPERQSKYAGLLDFHIWLKGEWL